MRKSTKHATVLALQTQHLDRLQTSVESGNVALIGHITAFSPQQVTTDEASHRVPLNRNTRVGKPLHNHLKRGRSHKYHLPLPRWLVACVWELGCMNATTCGRSKSQLSTCAPLTHMSLVSCAQAMWELFGSSLGQGNQHDNLLSMILG